MAPAVNPQAGQDGRGRKYVIGLLIVSIMSVIAYFLFTFLLTVLPLQYEQAWPSNSVEWGAAVAAISLLFALGTILFVSYRNVQSNDLQEEVKSEDQGGTRLVSSLLLVTAGIVAVLLTTRASLQAIIQGERNSPELLLAFTLMGFFPLSYAAYHLFRSQSRIERLKHDLVLLNYPEEKAKELYEHSHSLSSYLLFIALTMLVTMIGTSLLFTPSLDDYNVNVNTLLAMRYGFLGGYIFSAYLVYRRYSTNDLNPTVYLYCAFVMIAGIGFNYVAVESLVHIASESNKTPDTGIGAGLLAVLAFSIGYFPYLAVRWFNNTAYRALQIGQRRADGMPLGILDGISDWHETRLRDNGIDDVQNLAAAEVRDLLVNTAFSAQQVIAWIDQASLYVYLEPSEIQSFRRAKICMLSDFRECWISCGQNDDERKVVAQILQSTPEKLDMLYSSTSEGPNIHRVLDYWSRARRDAEATQSKGKIDALLNVVKAETSKFTKRDAPPVDTKKVFSSLNEILEMFSKGSTLMSAENFGDLYLLIEDNDKALERYDEAIEEDEKNAHIYEKRAVAHAQDRNYVKAIYDSTQAIELIPSDDRRELADAYARRAYIHYYFEQYGNAEKDMESASTLQPEDSELHNKLASTILNRVSQEDKLLEVVEKGNLLEKSQREARMAVEKAKAEVLPNYVDCLDTLAWTKITLAKFRLDQNKLDESEGFLAEADASLEKARERPAAQVPIEVYPNIAERYMQAADVYVKLSERSEYKDRHDEFITMARKDVELAVNTPNLSADQHSNLVSRYQNLFAAINGSNGSQ